MRDLTQGNSMKTMVIFAAPMILGNFLQQFYNFADTMILGRYLGPDAMAAAGTAYTLMTFLTSILIGMTMGSSSLLSYYMGKKDMETMREYGKGSFYLTGAVTLVLLVLVFVFVDPIMRFLQIPPGITGMFREYILVIFGGLLFVFLYNFYAFYFRAMGDSVTPLLFLGGSSLLNVALDLLFVAGLKKGISGAAWATWISQAVAGIGIFLSFSCKNPEFRRKGVIFGKRKSFRKMIREIARFSFAASIQQSVMNFGILMVQGLVNSFGVPVMAAFTAAVKIDAIAYMPAQEFGNSFSLFISQNYGAGEKDRIRKGTKEAFLLSALFCSLVSFLVYFFAESLMHVFLPAEENFIVQTGVTYLRIEGACYVGIGILFLLYGYFRGIHKPEMSLVLTIISLGTRVALAYGLVLIFHTGPEGIWWSIPIGWFLADVTGICCMKEKHNRKRKEDLK